MQSETAAATSPPPSPPSAAAAVMSQKVNSACKLTLTAGDGAQVWRGGCGSLGHVRCHLLFQTLAEAVVEEEELAVRKQAAEQSVDTVALQQDLQGKRCQ